MTPAPAAAKTPDASSGATSSGAPPANVPIAIPAPGPDVLRRLVREMQDAEISARTHAEAAATARGRAVATEAALRAALNVPDGATLDLEAGVFRLA